MGLICAYKVILRFLRNVKANTSFPILQPTLTVKATSEQSKRPTITEGPIGFEKTWEKLFARFSISNLTKTRSLQKCNLGIKC